MILAGSIIGFLYSMEDETSLPVHKNTAQHRTEAMQDLANELPRIPVPRYS
jgi:hypothetical protein